MTKRLEHPKIYTHTCSNPNCGKVFEDNSPHTKWCKDIPCQRYAAALHSRNKFHRDHGLNLCKGGCGRYVFKAWCGSPECRAKQQAYYDARRPIYQHEQKPKKDKPKSEYYKWPCEYCGGPIPKDGQYYKVCGKLACVRAWKDRSESIPEEFWGFAPEVDRKIISIPGIRPGNFRRRAAE